MKGVLFQGFESSEFCQDYIKGVKKLKNRIINNQSYFVSLQNLKTVLKEKGE